MVFNESLSWKKSRRGLGPLASDAPGQLDVLGHDRDALSVDGAQVGVLEQADQVGLGGFLKKMKQKHTLSTDRKKC